MSKTTDGAGEGKPAARPSREAPITWAITAAAFVGLSWVGFNASMMLGLVGAILGLVILIRSLVRGARAPERRRAQVIIGLSALVIMTAGPTTCALQTKILEADLVPVLDALERYRADHGDFPEALESLRPQYLSVSPACPFCTRSQPFYLRMSEGDVPSYDLTCKTFGFNNHSYDSSRRDWHSWD